MIAGISLVASAVFGGDMTNLVGYVGIGIVIWSAITALVAEGSMAFIRNANFITSSNLGTDLYIGRTVFKILITFSHHAFLYVVGAALLLVPVGWTSLLALVGIALLFINGFWVVASLAFLCARFRDVELIVRNLLQLAFFVTPVFWNYEQISDGRRFIVDFNLLFYFVEIIRGPLLGRIPPLHYYVVVALATAAGYAFAYLVYRRMRRRLAIFV
jgi:ABC-type polysaccharide/polyol phosphate export permease